jgi:hypothetical protein
MRRQYFVTACPEIVSTKAGFQSLTPPDFQYLDIVADPTTCSTTAFQLWMQRSGSYVIAKGTSANDARAASAPEFFASLKVYRISLAASHWSYDQTRYPFTAQPLVGKKLAVCTRGVSALACAVA